MDWEKINGNDELKELEIIIRAYPILIFKKEYLTSKIKVRRFTKLKNYDYMFSNYSVQIMPHVKDGICCTSTVFPSVILFKDLVSFQELFQIEARQ